MPSWRGTLSFVLSCGLLGATIPAGFAAPPAPAAPPQRAAAESGDADREALIREALSNRGRPYVRGGSSRGGFDCSGFVQYLFKHQYGTKLPHSASAQSRYGKPVAMPDLQAGDLLFFRTYRRSISHVGVYIGSGKFIHAANPRRDVRVDTLTGYYRQRFQCARRLNPTHANPRDL